MHYLLCSLSSLGVSLNARVQNCTSYSLLCLADIQIPSVIVLTPKLFPVLAMTQEIL